MPLRDLTAAIDGFIEANSSPSSSQAGQLLSPRDVAEMIDHIKAWKDGDG